MNTFSDLSRRVDDLDPPHVDLDALVASGERRLRRRRVASAAAGAVVVAVLAVGGTLANSDHSQTTGPIDIPNHLPKETVPTPVTRQVVYAGGLGDPTIYYGDREVEVPTGYVHLDVTDDGFVYTAPGTMQKGDPTVWFSDGGKPQQIGTHCGANLPRTPNDVMTGSSGSLVVWEDCLSPSRGRVFVVYDTSLRREVLRRSIPGCGHKDFHCVLTAVVGEHVYVSRPVGNTFHMRGLLLDVGTGSLRVVTPRYWPAGGLRRPAAYLADLRSQGRALVVGGSFDSGTLVDGIGLGFAVSGSRLIPQLDTETPATSAYDTSGRPVLLRLQPGYHSADWLSLVQWLDDDTIVLGVTGEHPHSGDALTCHLPDGRCEQVVTGPGSDTSVGQPLFPTQELPS